MSSDPPSAGPSPATEAERDGVLLGALEERLPGAREHAGATASYALGTGVQLGLDREECILVREAGRLHEVGKLYMRVAAACEYDRLARAHGEGGQRQALIGLIELAGGRLDPMVVDALARVVERAAGRIAGP